MNSIAAKVGCTAESLRKWVRQAERALGIRGGVASVERERLKALECENRELKRANGYSGKPLRICPGGTRPLTEMMVSFVDEYAVEPICVQLPIGPSIFYHHQAKRDDILCLNIQHVWEENFRAHGTRKI